MVNVTRSLLVLSLLVGAPSFAASQATVGVKIAELRIKPDDGAFSRLKIPGGREVAVLGKSDDGRWIKVRTQIERGDDLIKLEGWLEVSQLKGADPSSLQVASGGESGGSKSSSASTWSDTSSSFSGSSDDSWGSTETAPAASTGSWGDASSEPASSSGDAMGEWDLGAGSAAESAPTSSDNSWDTGSTDSGSSDSSSGDSWESSDSGSSDSGSSADDGGW